VALEVADIRIVVCREEADGIVDLCARVDDALRMVTEARKIFSMLAFFAVVDLEGIVVACDNG
jgi:hypothetical protein